MARLCGRAGGLAAENGGFRPWQYLHCKQGVLPPSDWPATARRICARACEKPDVWLQLEHVFGYNGPKNIQPNVYFTARGEVCILDISEIDIGESISGCPTIL